MLARDTLVDIFGGEEKLLISIFYGSSDFCRLDWAVSPPKYYYKLICFSGEELYYSLGSTA